MTMVGILEGIWKLRRLAASQHPLSVKPGNFGSSAPNAGS
jgi:hypothetical protein